MESRIVLGPRIAEGGMAEVFAARLEGSEGFAKDVVVKRVLPQLARDPEFIQRFLAEARLAAQLSHPNIVQVLSLVADRGDLMMAMELVDGADLSTILKALRPRGETLSLPLALRVASSVAAALAYAHEKRDRAGRPLGIVHRDVTPSNVLVSRDGATKLIDFGIARASSHARVTRRGVIVGKLQYMAPEQARDLDVDARVDVWACGVVLFQMLTGRRPFVGADDAQILSRICNGERPDVRSFVAVPEALARIVDGALAVDRDRRTPSARALAQAIDDVIAREGLYASAAELGALVEALVPPAALEVTTARADGRSQTASGGGTVSTISAVLGLAPTVSTDGLDDEVNDTTPARKQRPRAASLTLDSAETTFVFQTDGITRLVSAARDATTEPGTSLDVQETQTLKRLDRPDRPDRPRPPAQATPVRPVRPRRALRRASLAGAAVVVVCAGALGAWGAFASAPPPTVVAPLAQSAPAPVAIVPARRDEPRVATPVDDAPRAARRTAKPARRAPVARVVEAPVVQAPVVQAPVVQAPVVQEQVAREPGTLVIDSRPWSRVSIDGVDVGVTPVAARTMQAGTYTLVFENEGQGLRKTATVTVKSGKTTTTRLDLRK